MLIYEFIDPEAQLKSEDFQFIENFLKFTKRDQLGWHYITDIIWIYSFVKNWSRNIKVLDAGGGQGPVQFLLAEMGFNVTNVDLVLVDLPAKYRHRYKTDLETLPSFEPSSYESFLSNKKSDTLTRAKVKFKKLIKTAPAYSNWSSNKYSTLHDNWRSSTSLLNTSIGSIKWYRGNLCKMPEIPCNYFDAVVSLSAWEHIPYEHLSNALVEIKRVLKPDGRWAVTTSATEKDKTWWHDPSQSNCFSIADLENIFGARSCGNQNPENILEKYNQCDYLKDSIAEFYKKSGKYGMPWGVWEPKYIPVGLSQ